MTDDKLRAPVKGGRHKRPIRFVSSYKISFEY